MNEDAQSLPSAPLDPKSGFRSAKDRYEDIRKEQEEELLRKIDQKAIERKKLIEAPKGKKRQMQGHDNIANFFTKKSKPALAPTDRQPLQLAVKDSRQLSTLQDVTNTLLANTPASSSFLTSAPPLQKPRTAPRPRQTVAKADVDQKQDDTRYVFLSSSPVRNREFDEKPIEAVAPKPAPRVSSHGFQAASTFHTTSMDKAAPQRRTLGINRSLQGWLPKRRP
jgi:DNA helicase-2/ATP-dependent DNA helicase PcrA